MQPLDSIVLIAEIILFVVLSILSIYLMVSLKRITGSVERIEKNMDDLQQKVIPVLDNALTVTENVKEISTDIKNNLDKVDTLVTSVKDRTESLLEFEKNAQDKIEFQVNNTLNLISAISTGFRTFLTALSGSKNHRPRKISFSHRLKIRIN
ncbi:MAG: DUF948 domain-containing protein [Ignavibacteria bacterium]